MPLSRRAALIAASGAAVAALVAGCGSSGSSGSGSAASTAPAAPSSGAGTATGSGTGQSAGAVVLQTASSAFGTIVTDGNGFTLYRFDHDTASPSASNCNGSCATLWPPVVSTGGTPQLKGVDAKLVSTVTRADGTKQVTLNGWPLYRYSPDAKPGDTKGQGFGGIWFVTAPNGSKITASTSPSGGSSGGGYGY
jgi:predicted lipoprotein with Yx(FWY)xxD motif